MKHLLLSLVLSLSSLLYSSDYPSSTTGEYVIAGNVERGLLIPFADFRVVNRFVDNGAGESYVYESLIHPGLRFSVTHDFFPWPLVLRDYASWFTEDIRNFNILQQKIVYGGAWGDVPVFIQSIADFKTTIHQLFIVRGGYGMGVCVYVPHGAPAFVEQYWDRVLNDAINFVQWLD